MNISKIIYFMSFINLCYSYNFRDILNTVDLNSLVLPCKANTYVTCQFKRGNEANQYIIIIMDKYLTINKIILKAMFNDRLHKIYFKIINQYTNPLRSMSYLNTDIYDIENDIYPYKYIFGFYSYENEISFSTIRIPLEYHKDNSKYLNIEIDIEDIFEDYYKKNKFEDIYTFLPKYTIDEETDLNLRNIKQVEAALNDHIVEGIRIDEIKDIYSKINKLKYFKCTDRFCYYKNFKIYSKIEELGLKKPLYVVIRCLHGDHCLRYEHLFFKNHAILVYKDSLSGKFYVIDNDDETQQIHELFEFWGKIDQKYESVLNVYSIN